jgi:hypothetical protein
MSQLDAQDRDQLKDSQFAYVDSSGEGHLPIHDAAHARNAMARFNQTAFESKAAKERARQKILSAARKFDIEVSDEAQVAKPVKSLRAASTKQGPKGGRRAIKKT